MPRLSFLDALRGLAACLVLVSHFGGSLSPEMQWHMLHTFNIGHVGVVVFFLVSGYIIPRSLDRAPDLRAFVVRRFFRLFPLYWFLILVALLLAGSQALGLVAANLSMLPALFRQPLLIGVSWTLGLELAFYTLVVLLRVLKMERHTVGVLAMLLVGAWFFEGYLPLHYSIVIGLPVFSYLAMFWAGTIAARIEGKQINRWLGYGLIVLILVSVTVPFDGRFVLLSRNEPNHIGARLVGFLIFFGVFTFRARPWPRVLVWLGTISYSLYLTHELVIAYAPRNLLLWIALTLVCSALTERLIERPGIALGKHLTFS